MRGGGFEGAKFAVCVRVESISEDGSALRGLGDIYGCFERWLDRQKCLVKCRTGHYESRASRRIQEVRRFIP